MKSPATEDINTLIAITKKAASRPFQRAAALAFFVLLVAINLIGAWIRITNEGTGSLDMRTEFTANFVQESLQSYERSGAVDIYRGWFIPVDFVFIVSYVVAGTLLVQHLRPRLRGLVFLPLLTGIADGLENVTELLLMQTGFNQESFIVLTALTLVKDAGIILLLAWLATRGIRALGARNTSKTRATLVFGKK